MLFLVLAFKKMKMGSGYEYFIRRPALEIRAHVSFFRAVRYDFIIQFIGTPGVPFVLKKEKEKRKHETISTPAEI